MKFIFGNPKIMTFAAINFTILTRFDRLFGLGDWKPTLSASTVLFYFGLKNKVLHSKGTFKYLYLPPPPIFWCGG